jgi:hypothetical protein
MPPVWERFSHVPTMLSGGELKMLYWLARDQFTGRGEIVDAGAFLGGSTMALCHGLADNPGAFRKTGAVHSFDWFRYEAYFVDWFRPLCGPLNEGESFLALFERLTAPFRRFVRVYPGDLLATPYEGGDVEILFVDICKSWELNASVIDQFFHRLIPGVSLVVHQDYLHFYEYWLVLTMDHFRDYFERLGAVEDGGSVLYRYVRRIPEEVFKADVRALPREAKCAAFERELPRLRGWQRNEMIAGYVRMLAEEGDREAARAVLKRMPADAADNPINRNSIEWLTWNYFPVHA